MPSAPKHISLSQELKENEIQRTNEQLKAGYGSKLQVLSGYAVADTHSDVCYYSPFCKDAELPFETAIWELRQNRVPEIGKRNNQYIVFAKESMFLVEKITRPEALMLYCLTYSSLD